MVVDLVEIGEVPREVLKFLAGKIKKTYGPLIGECIKGPSLELPPASYSARRKQYDADIILERLLRRVRGENKLLGILGVDLYTSSQKLNFIFGQAQFPGRAALISLCRLDPAFYGQRPDAELFLRRAGKEAIHELGHTFGLTHCSDLSCVMSFSNSILDVDRKSSAFCERCWTELFR